MSGPERIRAVLRGDDPKLYRVAAAILKARYYDIEPEMYEGEAGFWRDMPAEHIHDAVNEAAVAIAAMEAP